jgi:transposase
MQVNQLCGLLYDFDVVLPQGRRTAVEAANASIASIADQLPVMLTDSLQDQISRQLVLDEQMQRVELRITEWCRGVDACRRISEIPGGITFRHRGCRSHRQRSGLQVGTRVCRLSRTGAATEPVGGKVKLGGISKRGDVYLRALPIH